MNTLLRSTRPDADTEYDNILAAWRDLHILFLAVCISWHLVHDGIMSAWVFVQSMQRNSEWCKMMMSKVTVTPAVAPNTDPNPPHPDVKLAHPRTTYFARTLPIRDLLERLKSQVEKGEVFDSPKMLALLKLIRQHRWLTHWQKSKQAIEAAEQTKQQTKPPLTGVTVIAVQPIGAIPYLQLLLSRWFKSAILMPPEPTQAEPNLSVEQRMMRELRCHVLLL